MNAQTANLDYCGIVVMLRALINEGLCTELEAKKTAARVAAKFGITIIFPL